MKLEVGRNWFPFRSRRTGMGEENSSTSRLETMNSIPGDRNTRLPPELPSLAALSRARRTCSPFISITR